MTRVLPEIETLPERRRLFAESVDVWAITAGLFMMSEKEISGVFVIELAVSILKAIYVLVKTIVPDVVVLQ